MDAQKPFQDTCLAILQAFDVGNTSSIDVNDAGTVLRALDVYIPEPKLNELIDSMREQQEIKFDMFMKTCWPIISQKLYPPNTETQLSRAFMALDSEKTGSISAGEFKALLLTQGEPMTNEEVDAMFNSVSVYDGRFPYEEYLALFVNKISQK